MIIKSSNSDAVLEFSQHEDDYFAVSFRSSGRSATVRVFGYTDTKHLGALFQVMASEWKGWSGTKEWASIEREFIIECTADGRGHVAIRVVLQNQMCEEPWKLEAVLNTDSGLLAQYAEEAKRFFNVS
jgi:hypothetical protein